MTEFDEIKEAIKMLLNKLKVYLVIAVYATLVLSLYGIVAARVETETHEFHVGPEGEAIFVFAVRSTGVISLVTEWRGAAEETVLILQGPYGETHAQREGPSPLIIEFWVTEQLLERGVEWRVIFANLDGGEAEGVLTINYPGAAEERPEEGWCCRDGEVFPTSEPECYELGGRFFPNEAEAWEYCRAEVPLPEGWCCRDGEVFPTSEPECYELGGRFFPNEAEAWEHCRAEMPPELVKPLKKVGVYTGEQLMAAITSQAALKSLAERTGLSPEDLMQMALKAELMTLEGIGTLETELLMAAGVESLGALASIRDPVALQQILAELAEQTGHPAPPVERVALWIELAGTVEPNFFAGVVDADVFSGERPEEVSKPRPLEVLRPRVVLQTEATIDEAVNALILHNTDVFTFSETIGGEEILYEYGGPEESLSLRNIGVLDELALEAGPLLLIPAKCRPSAPLIRFVQGDFARVHRGGKGKLDILGENFGTVNVSSVTVEIRKMGTLMVSFPNVPVRPYAKAPQGVSVDLVPVRNKLGHGRLEVFVVRDGCRSGFRTTELMPPLPKCWDHPVIQRINQYRIYLLRGGKGIVDILGVNFGVPNQTRVDVKLVRQGKVVHTFTSILVGPYAKAPHGVRIDLSKLPPSKLRAGIHQLVVQRPDGCTSNPGKIEILPPEPTVPYVLMTLSKLHFHDDGEGWSRGLPEQVWAFSGKSGSVSCELSFPAKGETDFDDEGFENCPVPGFHQNPYGPYGIDVPIFCGRKERMGKNLVIGLSGVELDDSTWHDITGGLLKAAAAVITLVVTGDFSTSGKATEIADKIWAKIPSGEEDEPFGVHGAVYLRADNYGANIQPQPLWPQDFDTSSKGLKMLDIGYQIQEVQAPYITELKVTLNKLHTSGDIYLFARAAHGFVFGGKMPTSIRIPASGDHEFDGWWTINKTLWHVTYPFKVAYDPTKQEPTQQPMPMVYVEVDVWDYDINPDDHRGLFAAVWRPDFLLDPKNRISGPDAQGRSKYRVHLTSWACGPDGSFEFHYSIEFTTAPAPIPSGG